MSYSCDVHGWQHLLNSCPMCFYSSSVITQRNQLRDADNRRIKELEAELDSALAAASIHADEHRKARVEVALEREITAVLTGALEEIAQLASLDACMNAIGIAKPALAKAESLRSGK